ncbi:MAG: zinc ribbon domain-containing protein [Planctomycetes bacterium]|nr:zinc ribbon domain-containing protein [Planctomycetota bacterium]
MAGRLRYIGRAIGLFFRLFIVRSLNVMFRPEPEPAPAPPVIAKAEKTQTLLSMIIIGIMPLACIVGPWLRKIGPYTHYLPWGIAILAAIDVLMLHWLGRASRSLARQAVQSEYAFCPACGYSLKGLPDEYRCPECGEPYDIAIVKKTWERYVETQRSTQRPWSGRGQARPKKQPPARTAGQTDADQLHHR